MRLTVKAQLPGGSWQNPTYSPDVDGEWLLITIWHRDYNRGTASLHAINLKDTNKVVDVTHALDGKVNVSQPGCGSCWHPHGLVIFSSTVTGNDWPHTIKPDGSGLVKLPGDSEKYAGYEPTLAPNGRDFAFERHVAGEEGNGQIVAVINGETKELTSSDDDCRQPAWSPDGNHLAYQQFMGDDRVDAVVRDLTSGKDIRLTDQGEWTDITWHPDSKRVLVSADGGLWHITLASQKTELIVPCPHGIKYLGAPSWNMRGTRIAAEACDHDPDIAGSKSWIEMFDL